LHLLLKVRDLEDIHRKTSVLENSLKKVLGCGCEPNSA